MQYIYSPRKKDFERYTLYNFYKDMDLYITQLGRDHLIEVSEVMINSASAAEDYTVTSPTGESVTLPSVTVDALSLIHICMVFDISIQKMRGNMQHGAHIYQ